MREDARTPKLSRDVEVLRRIPPLHFPKAGGRTRPNSSAFTDDRDGGSMSVRIADEHEASLALAQFPGFGLVARLVSDLEDMGLEVVRDPLPEEPLHALVRGPKTKSIRRQLAEKARWVVPPL